MSETLQEQAKRHEDEAVKLRAVLARFPDAAEDIRGAYLSNGVNAAPEGLELRPVGACLYADVVSIAGRVRVYSRCTVDFPSFATAVSGLSSDLLTDLFDTAAAIDTAKKADAEAREPKCVKYLIQPDSISDGGAVFVPGNGLSYEHTQQRFHVTKGGQYSAGEEIPIVASEIGPALVVGTRLVFDSPPPGCSVGAVIVHIGRRPVE